MHGLPKHEALALLNEMNATRNGVFRRIVEDASAFFRFSIEDESAFHSLVWHSSHRIDFIPKARWFGGKLHTVGQVADMIIERGLTFTDLADRQRKAPHKPSWFGPCTEIERKFEYSRFGPVVVRLLQNDERRDCPAGTFRLIDGCHRALVMTYLLKTRRLTFQSVPCLLVITTPPRLLGIF